MTTTRQDVIAPRDDISAILVLGSCLQDPDTVCLALKELRPSDFFLDAHRIIFAGIGDLAHENIEVSDYTVTQELIRRGQLEKVGGSAYIESLVIQTPTVAHAPRAIKAVLDCAQKARYLGFFQQAIERIKGNGASAETFRSEWCADLKELGILSPPESAGTFVESVGALLTEPDIEIDWLVEGILGRGDAGFVASEPKLIKSWLLDLLAVCLSTGQPFLGFAVPSRCRVLLMSEEDSRRRLRRRLKQLIAGLGGPTPSDEWLHFTSRTGFKLDDPEWIERLRAELTAFQPDLVLMDVLRRLHDLDENSNMDMGKLTNTLNALRRQFGCGFLIAHHNRKPAQGNVKRGRGGQEMSGAGVLHGWSEAALYLTKGSGHGRVIVTVEHKDAPEAEAFVIRLEDSKGSDGQKAVQIINEGPATVDRGAQTRAKILEVLSPMIGQSVKDLASALGMHVNSVRAHLKALEADGAVRNKKADVGQTVLWFVIA